MMKFERVRDIAAMQYKLFSPHQTWLPLPPDLSYIEDGELPVVSKIVRDPYEWIGGMGNLLQGDSSRHIDATKLRLETASSEQVKTKLLLEQSKAMFEKLADDTGGDMLLRFQREEEGFFELHKRMQLHSSARNKDELTRDNTASAGYIVWLQDTEEGEWRSVVPKPIMPQDVMVVEQVVGGGGSLVDVEPVETQKSDDAQSRRSRSAAHDIDTAARNMLAWVRIFSV